MPSSPRTRSTSVTGLQYASRIFRARSIMLQMPNTSHRRPRIIVPRSSLRCYRCIQLPRGHTIQRRGPCQGAHRVCCRIAAATLASHSSRGGVVAILRCSYGYQSAPCADLCSWMRADHPPPQSSEQGPAVGLFWVLSLFYVGLSRVFVAVHFAVFCFGSV